MSMYHGELPACLLCKSELDGRQTTWCSERCRSAFRNGTHLRARTCRFCHEKLDDTNQGTECRTGSPRMPDDPRYTARDERRDENADVFPGEKCWSLQQEDIRRKREAQQAIDSPVCVHCGEEGEYAGIGRHRKYCSDSCRVAAFRARKRGRAPRETQQTA